MENIFWICIVGGGVYLFVLAAKSASNTQFENEKSVEERKRDIERDYALEQERLREFEKKLNLLITSLIDTHIRALIVKVKQSITQDAYGIKNFDKWYKECDYFIDNVLSKNGEINKYLEDPLTNKSKRIDIYGLIAERIKDYNDSVIKPSNDPLSIDEDELDPLEFENYCVDILNNNGWKARTTKGSGDQGIDIVAFYGNTKAVFQCKKYSKPVGNAAVQEIFAGKAHEQANVAAVVSNAAFTPAAKHLASTTDVHLLHYGDLPQFAARIFETKI